MLKNLLLNLSFGCLMPTVYGDETDCEIELESCPKTRLTNVTLIKSRSLTPSKKDKRGLLTQMAYASTLARSA